MVALQVRGFDKTYEFKINLLQVRSVFECRWPARRSRGTRVRRVTRRATADRPARIKARTRPPYSTVRAQQRTARRGAEHACLRTTTVVLHRTTHGSRGARPRVGRGSVLAERTLHSHRPYSAAQLSAVHTKLLPDCPRLNGVRIRAHRLQHRGLHLRCRRVCRRRVQQPAAQLRL